MLPPLAFLNDLRPAGGNYTLGFVGLGMGRLILEVSGGAFERRLKA